MGKKKRSSKKKKGIGVMNIILIIVGVSLFAFTIAMIQIFRECGAVPDTLVTCVFAALAGECGIMGWIKTTKERKQDRAWQQQDKREAEREMREAEKRAQEQQQQNVNTFGG